VAAVAQVVLLLVPAQQRAQQVVQELLLLATQVLCKKQQVEQLPHQVEIQSIHLILRVHLQLHQAQQKQLVEH
jgi:hypothetical protein